MTDGNKEGGSSGKNAAAASIRERARKLLRRTVILLAAGALYALFYLRTGIGIPCPLRSFTGLKCPGCGATRMCISLLKGDLAAAWQYNPVLCCLLPLLLLLLAWGICFYIRTGSIAYPRIVNYLLYAALAALIVFFFARNIAEGNFAELFSRIKAFFSG